MNNSIRKLIALLAIPSLAWLSYGQEASEGQESETGQPDTSGEAAMNEAADAPADEDLDRLFEGIDSDSLADDENGVGGEAESPLEMDMGLAETDTISVDFPNEEIRTVLRNVADLYGLNIVVPQTLQGTTSIKLRDVNWRQIFNTVLDPVGFTFVEEGNIIKIVSKEQLNFEPPVTEIFMVDYASAQDVAATLSSMVDAQKGGRVQIDTRTNSLIVTERPSKMESIKEVIDRLDKPTQQVLIETRFIEVVDNDVSDVGIDWASLQGWQLSAGDIGREFNETEEREEITGINGLQSLINTRTTERLTTAVFNADQFNVVLSLLNSNENSRLVSNPTVVTLNNQEAYIAIGEEFPFPRYTYNQETGAFEVNGFDKEDIGVKLRVTPSVNTKGLITMKVVPEVSSRTGTVTFASAEVPIISSRTTTTQIALQDGFTMGIGGLIETRETDRETRVPGLSRIPGLGRLFRSNNTDLTNLNLLIFITAKILPSEEADFSDVFSSERMSRANVDPEALKHR